MHVTCNRFFAGFTLLGIQIAKTFEAVWAVIAGGEVLASKLDFTACAYKALLMPWLIPIGHTTFSQGLRRIEFIRDTNSNLSA